MFGHPAGGFGGQIISLRPLGQFAGLHRAADLMRNISEMAERAGDVAFINRPEQVGGLAAAVTCKTSLT